MLKNVGLNFYIRFLSLSKRLVLGIFLLPTVLRTCVCVGTDIGCIKVYLRQLICINFPVPTFPFSPWNLVNLGLKYHFAVSSVAL